MTPQGRKVWSSPQGGQLLGKMLRATPLTEADRKTLELLKQQKAQKPANEPKL